jgi:putative two-component system response regulator
VLSHHERWDGSGYPRGLKGKRIPLEARVVAIADTFDAITQSRRYKRARSVAVAARAIQEGRGTQFQPDLVDLFLSAPVMKSVKETFAASHRPGLRNHRRNGKKIGRPVPDVRFRWRTVGVARPLRGR